MKRILYLFAAAVLALSACTKGADVVGGHDSYYSTPGGRYMMHIADELIAGALENLEIAIEMGKTEVTWASRFSGMKIEKAGENLWHLSFEGLFAFDNKSYQTGFTMTATRLNEKKHADWDVTIQGSRLIQVVTRVVPFQSAQVHDAVVRAGGGLSGMGISVNRYFRCRSRYKGHLTGFGHSILINLADLI